MRYNIMAFPEHGVNYWGIPKRMSTAIKCALLGESGEGICVWAHHREMDRYISQDKALSNGLRNFTYVRDPVDRFRSLYKDFGLRRKVREFRGVDEFIDFARESKNVHFRSMSSFLKSGVDVLKTPKEVEDYLGLSIDVINETDGDIELTREQVCRVRSLYSEDLVYGGAGGLGIQPGMA